MLHKAQFEYNDELAAMCGPDVALTPSWRLKMYDETGGWLFHGRVNRRCL